ncbi:MAG: pirin family protein, partial [Bacteroidota bacterium]
MDRKNFLKKSLLGAAGLAAGGAALGKSSEDRQSTYDKLMEQVGFNHLPNEEIATVKSVLH